MACSGCIQRQQALLRAGRATVNRDVEKVVTETKYVARSALEDMIRLREKFRQARKTRSKEN